MERTVKLTKDMLDSLEKLFKEQKGKYEKHNLKVLKQLNVLERMPDV